VGERLSGISTFHSLFGAQLIFVGSKDGVFAIIFDCRILPEFSETRLSAHLPEYRIHRNFRASLFHKRRLPKGFEPLILSALFVGP